MIQRAIYLLGFLILGLLTSLNAQRLNPTLIDSVPLPIGSARNYAEFIGGSFSDRNHLSHETELALEQGQVVSLSIDSTRNLEIRGSDGSVLHSSPAHEDIGSRDDKQIQFRVPEAKTYSFWTDNFQPFPIRINRVTTEGSQQNPQATEESNLDLLTNYSARTRGITFEGKVGEKQTPSRSGVGIFEHPEIDNWLINSETGLPSYTQSFHSFDGTQTFNVINQRKGASFTAEVSSDTTAEFEWFLIDPSGNILEKSKGPRLVTQLTSVGTYQLQLLNKAGPDRRIPWSGTENTHSVSMSLEGQPTRQGSANLRDEIRIPLKMEETGNLRLAGENVSFTLLSPDGAKIAPTMTFEDGTLLFLSVNSSSDEGLLLIAEGTTEADYEGDLLIVSEELDLDVQTLNLPQRDPTSLVHGPGRRVSQGFFDPELGKTEHHWQSHLVAGTKYDILVSYASSSSSLILRTPTGESRSSFYANGLHSLTLRPELTGLYTLELSSSDSQALPFSVEILENEYIGQTGVATGLDSSFQDTLRGNGLTTLSGTLISPDSDQAVSSHEYLFARDPVILRPDNFKFHRSTRRSSLYQAEIYGTESYSYSNIPGGVVVFAVQGSDPVVETSTPGRLYNVDEETGFVSSGFWIINQNSSRQGLLRRHVPPGTYIFEPDPIVAFFSNPLSNLRVLVSQAAEPIIPINLLQSAAPGRPHTRALRDRNLRGFSGSEWASRGAAASETGRHQFSFEATAGEVISANTVQETLTIELHDADGELIGRSIERELRPLSNPTAYGVPVSQGGSYTLTVSSGITTDYAVVLGRDTHVSFLLKRDRFQLQQLSPVSNVVFDGAYFPFLSSSNFAQRISNNHFGATLSQLDTSSLVNSNVTIAVEGASTSVLNDPSEDQALILHDGGEELSIRLQSENNVSNEFFLAEYLLRLDEESEASSGRSLRFGNIEDGVEVDTRQLKFDLFRSELVEEEVQITLEIDPANEGVGLSLADHEAIRQGVYQVIFPAGVSRRTLHLNTSDDEVVRRSNTVRLRAVPPANFDQQWVAVRSFELIEDDSSPERLEDKEYSAKFDQTLVVPAAQGLLRGATDSDTPVEQLRVVAETIETDDYTITFDPDGGFTATFFGEDRRKREFYIRFSITDGFNTTWQNVIFEVTDPLEPDIVISKISDRPLVADGTAQVLFEVAVTNRGQFPYSHMNFAFRASDDSDASFHVVQKVGRSTRIFCDDLDPGETQRFLIAGSVDNDSGPSPIAELFFDPRDQNVIGFRDNTPPENPIVLQVPVVSEHSLETTISRSATDGSAFSVSVTNGGDTNIPILTPRFNLPSEISATIGGELTDLGPGETRVLQLRLAGAEQPIDFIPEVEFSLSGDTTPNGSARNLQHLGEQGVFVEFAIDPEEDYQLARSTDLELWLPVSIQREEGSGSLNYLEGTGFGDSTITPPTQFFQLRRLPRNE